MDKRKVVWLKEEFQDFSYLVSQYCTNPKLQEIGRIAFFAGLLATLLGGGGAEIATHVR